MRHAQLLAKVPLFRGLEDADRDALASRLDEKRFAAGTLVFARGDGGASMYLIASGRAQVFLPPAEPGGARIVLKDLEAGEYFGELALFDEKPRSASVDVTADAVLLELTREDFAQHVGGSKTAALDILGEMSARLRETNELLTRRASTNAVQEIEKHLTWAERLGDRVAEMNGSWTFILCIFGVTCAWAAINNANRLAFDPFPFILYNLALGLFPALQGPLIVMSQNRQTTKDRAQAETDFRVNLKNEVGIEALAEQLAAFRTELFERCDAVAAKTDERRGAPSR